jgi:hypothetical protein
MNISQFVLVAPAGVHNRKAKIKIKKSFGLCDTSQVLCTYRGEDMKYKPTLFAQSACRPFPPINLSTLTNQTQICPYSRRIKVNQGKNFPHAATRQTSQQMVTFQTSRPPLRKSASAWTPADRRGSAPPTASSQIKVNQASPKFFNFYT